MVRRVFGWLLCVAGTCSLLGYLVLAAVFAPFASDRDGELVWEGDDVPATRLVAASDECGGYYGF